MKIKHKLLFSFGITILLTGFILVLFAFYSYRTTQKITTLKNYYSDFIDDAGSTQKTIQQINFNIEHFEILFNDKQFLKLEKSKQELKAYTDKLNSVIERWRSDVDRAVAVGKQIDIPYKIDEFNKLSNEIRIYEELVKNLIQYNTFELTYKDIRNKELAIYKVSLQIETKLQKIQDLLKFEIDTNLNELYVSTNKYFYLSISTAILLILLSIFAGISVYNSINTPIEQLKENFKKIDRGDYLNVIDYNKKDEIGELIESFNHVAKNLHDVQQELKTKNSELLEINQSLLNAKDKAEEADRLKSAFLANMSHEIRTPLNGIIGYADLLRNPNKTPEKQIRYVDMIKNSGKQLLHIINDIIDISRIEAGTMKKYESVFDLNFILDEARQSFVAETKKRNKNIEILFFKTFEKPLFIKSDEYKLRQIINNLIGNAIKFTNIGYIEYSYKIKNNFIDFYVKDTGIGIAPENHEHLFNRFNQTSSDIAHREGGTGLGLSISKGLVEILGGSIWFESVENQGSVFYFSIPFLPDDLLNQSDNIIEHINFNWENKTILIVEDNIINAEYISELLSETNVKVHYENSGSQAIERCMSDKSIDLVLMDIRLPDLDGYETTQIIKQYRPELPVIAQTAHASDEHRQKCIDAGCNDFISKPIEHVALLNLLDKFLSKKE